jgi:hypothetical protein
MKSPERPECRARASSGTSAPEVSRRLQPFAGTGQDIRADALINAGFAGLETAAEAWAASDGVLELPLLLEQAMATIST